MLQLIADFTDLNLVASDTVSGKITLRLNDVPWDQALDIVLKAKGLDKRQEGNILMVAPAAEIAERERLQVEANKQLEELAPLRTEFVRVRYADAGELFALFDSESGGGDNETATASILSERGSAIVDERTNTIILTDTEEKIAEFIRLINEIDIPIRQVLIEARIVEARDNLEHELGVIWGLAAVRSPNDDALVIGGSRDVLAEPDTAVGFFDGTGSLDLGEATAVDLGVANPTGSLSLGFISDNTFIDLELSALEDESRIEIVSQPKILTGDKQEAVVRTGQEFPFEAATSSGATSVEFKEAVLMLSVTPQITPDNRVIMTLMITKDSVGQQLVTGEVPFNVTQLETKALVGNGQTLVLGGVFETEALDQERKVPFLGDLPYLGRFFRQDIVRNEKTEILFFITPKIVDDVLLD